MSHTYAFDSFSVNGTVLNEPGINALVAGELGVPLVMVAGDDVVVEEIKKLFPDILGVTVKTSVGPNAAITEEYVTGVDQLLQRYRLTESDACTYGLTTSSAREIAHLIDGIERVVVR